jgi:2'-5' RNA ligase
MNSKQKQILIGTRGAKLSLVLFISLLLFFVVSCTSRSLQEDESFLIHQIGHQSNTDSHTSDNKLFLDPVVQNGRLVPFQTHANALAINIPYQPVADLRQQLERHLEKNLDNFKSWNPQGEAHITVVTPPEFESVLSKKLSMDEINAIAMHENIQTSDVNVLGLGTGRTIIADQNEETFFILVSSSKLNSIRESIHDAFVAKGGAPESWDYKTYYPHITVGFTKRDLHIQDGVIKDVEHSLDARFQLVLRAENQH